MLLEANIRGALSSKAAGNHSKKLCSSQSWRSHVMPGRASLAFPCPHLLESKDTLKAAGRVRRSECSPPVSERPEPKRPQCTKNVPHFYFESPWSRAHSFCNGNTGRRVGSASILGFRPARATLFVSKQTVPRQRLQWLLSGCTHSLCFCNILSVCTV